MVTLYNVIDTRTGKFHSEVIVKQRMVRFFVPAEEEDSLAHGIDGNDIDAMKKAKTDLTNHLIEQ